MACAGLVLALAACADGATAEEQACSARDDLRASVAELGDEVAAADLDEARDSLDEVGEDIEELTEALGDLEGSAAADVGEVQPLEDLRAIVERLRGTDELDAVGEGLADARDTAGAALDQLDAALEC